MINIRKLEAYAIPDTHMALTRRDTMLYGVGVGYGFDPMDERQLPYCTEKGQRTVPTMATITAAPHAWMKKADVGSGGKSVHAGITVRLNRPIPVEGNFTCKSTLGEVVDKGEGKAALITTHRTVYEDGVAEPLFTAVSTSMLRGDGGFGGPRQPAAPDPQRAEGEPDIVCDLPTILQQALIYRLSGDYNPLHSDPEAAARQGFPRPILHGLCTFGVAGHALLRSVCDYDADRLVEMGGRFSKPVYPGETLRTKIWRRGNDIDFLVTVPSRDDVIVLDFGHAKVSD
jgi:acyl dehydratase